MSLILNDPRMWYRTHGQEKELLESIEWAFKPIERMPRSLQIDINLIYKSFLLSNFPIEFNKKINKKEQLIKGSINDGAA